MYGSFMYGLQRLCYGALRPIEIEQLYEKAWFAITETCLAMTIFREEVGAWFLVMFVALLTGKVWGWIGDGRVEVLEQQPPANPRLFHIRLTISLGMSVLYDLGLMNYTINTVIQQARPNMMVMFLFEFAILTTSSFATSFRYCISLIEAKVVKKQTQERLLERRREVREERAEMIRQREAAVAAAGEGSDAVPSDEPLPSEDDVDEMDIEVPGWETKGHWVLTLDLITGKSALLASPFTSAHYLDFVKLGIYVTFFVILLMFYGLPIHIMRDLFLTARSFTKRLTAFMKYRRATRDMNKLYEDATVEDIQREDTCIICREEMRPWSVTNPQPPLAAPGAIPPARPATTVNERSRPKKLPCGHILHLGCLKSWLERQQMCPTCRRSVVVDPQQAQRDAANINPAGGAAQPALPGQQDGAGAPPPAANRGAGRGMRMLNLGPVRIGFGQANLQDLAQGLGGAQPGQENAAGGGPRVYGLELGIPRRLQPQPQQPAQGGANSSTSSTLQDHLQQVEQQIVAEIRSLQITQQELQLVQLLQAELARLRLIQSGQADSLTANFQMPQMPQLGPLAGRHAPVVTMPVPQMQRHGARSNAAAIPAGSADLPPGVTIPEGWSLLPLQRFDGLTGVPPAAGVPIQRPAANAAAAPTATTSLMGVSPMTGISNNILTPTPTPTTNPENHSQASSVDSSDTNAIHTPPSIAADQLNAPVLHTSIQDQSTTDSSTALEALAAQQDSSVLPNWGASQLFSAPSRAANSDNASSSIALPREGREGSVDERPSSFVEPETEEEQHRKEKGKAKAATVEDTVDEAEGS
jgi:E3 ubiquitin-protein ligase synoviolin